MFSYFVFILIEIIVFSQIIQIETLFVSVGDYSAENIDLNDLECGLSEVPTIVRFTYPTKCFKESIKDKTLLYFRIKQKTSQRVFLGEDVEPGDAPWVVYIFDTRLKWDSKHCTGSLLTPNWVITAAHCLEEMKDFWFSGSTITLSMGHIREAGVIQREIRKVDFIAHHFFLDPGSYFNRPVSDSRKQEIKYQHDIGLIRLRTPIERNIIYAEIGPKYTINTICLPKRDQTDAKRDERATFYGFGQIKKSILILHYLPDILKRGWVVMRKFGECGSLTEFCGWFAGDDPRPCQGDSGGPLVQFLERFNVTKAILIGTLATAGPSNATDCTREIKVANWIAVPKFIDWIIKTIKENQYITPD